MNWTEAITSPSPYMDQLIKKIEVLLTQLKPILPESQIQVGIFGMTEIQVIFGRILTQLSTFFISRFSTIEPQDIVLIGRERQADMILKLMSRIVSDIMCLLDVFRNIPGIQERGITLEDSFRTRYLYDQVNTTSTEVEKKDKEESNTDTIEESVNITEQCIYNHLFVG